MSSSAWRISFLSCTAAALLNPSPLKQPCLPIAPSPYHLCQCRRQTGSPANHHPRFRLSSVNDHENVKESSDMRSIEQAGFPGKDNHQEEPLTTYKVLERLKRYGISGVLSYGLLNTAYYLLTFLFVWLYVAPVPGGMGYVAAAERFVKILAMVWAGSQVTKLIRAGGALALAPAVDRGLSWFTVKFKFESQGKAFMAIAGFCFGLAFVVFIVLTMLWA